MITQKVAAKEARRLFTLPFPPPTEDDKKARLKEYCQVLCDSARTEEHCTAVIEWLVRHEKVCPAPSTLLMALDQVRVPDKTKAPLGCDQCQGSGYIQFNARVRTVAGEYTSIFSQPCDCALGQFIRPEYDKRRNRAPGAAQDLG